MTDDVAPPSLLSWRVVWLMIYGVLAALTLVLVTQVAWAQRLDDRLAASTGTSARSWMHHIDVITTPLIGLLGLIAVVGVGRQFARGRWMDALRPVAVVALSQTVVEVLKHVIHRSDGAVNMTPSGHTSLVLALAGATLMLWERAYLFTPGVAAFIAYGTVIGGWHTPGDVVAACAVTGFCVACIMPNSQVTRSDIRGRGGSIILGMLCALLGVNLHQIDWAHAGCAAVLIWVSIFVVLVIPTPQRRGEA